MVQWTERRKEGVVPVFKSVTAQEANEPWIGIYHPEWENPIEGQTDMENSNRGSTPIEGHFTPIWQI